MASVISCFGLTFLAFAQLTRSEQYPYALPVTTQGKCGKTDYLRRTGGLLIQQNSCLLSADSREEIWSWYMKNGRLPTDGRLYRVTSVDAWIRVISVERVLILEERSGEMMIRVYRDTTVIPPKALFPTRIRFSPNDDGVILPP